jgi:hypothetical protein
VGEDMMTSITVEMADPVSDPATTMKTAATITRVLSLMPI